LGSERPGILAWMIEGCLKWRLQKLTAPAAVIHATDTYLESEDALGQWLEEFCEKGAQFWEASSALYASWKSWAEDAGESAGSQRRFSQALESKSFEPTRKAKARGFSGFRLKANGKQQVALDILESAAVTLVTAKTVNPKL
jgi:putative DNA primase/helicase